MLIGHGRCSTNSQDLTAQRNALSAAGVDPDAIYVDHGFTGTKRDRPGLGKALAACRDDKDLSAPSEARRRSIHFLAAAIGGGGVPPE